MAAALRGFFFADIAASASSEDAQEQAGQDGG